VLFFFRYSCCFLVLIVFSFHLFCGSTNNLCHDTFLRRQMDDQGWVHIDVITKFNRVSFFHYDFILVPLLYKVVLLM
jgi:hypothetical protein